jgi:hypothetical protein
MPLGLCLIAAPSFITSLFGYRWPRPSIPLGFPSTTKFLLEADESQLSSRKHRATLVTIPNFD